jgi:hypothetical protein
MQNRDLSTCRMMKTEGRAIDVAESMQPRLLESVECDHIFSKFETFPVAFNVCPLAYLTAQKEMHVLKSKLSQFSRYEVVLSYIYIKLISFASILRVVCLFCAT